MTDTAAEEAFRALLERAVNQATNRKAVAMIADGFRRIPDDAEEIAAENVAARYGLDPTTLHDAYIEREDTIT